MSEKDRPTSRRGVLESFLTPRERKPRSVATESYPGNELREAAALAKELQGPITQPDTQPATPHDNYNINNNTIYKTTISPTVSPTMGVSNVGSRAGCDDTTKDPTKYPSTSPTTLPFTPPLASPSSYPAVSTPTYPTVAPTLRSDFNEYPLTSKQREVLLFLYTKPQRLTSKSEIVSATGISIETVKKIMQVLIKNQFIFKEGKRYIKGNFQGFKYNINEELCNKALYLTSNPTLYPTNHPTSAITPGLPDQRPGHVPHHLDDDLFINKNHHLSDHDLADMFPKLFECGFRSEHFVQVIRTWNFKKLNLEELNDSLERAEWDVAHNREIKSPCVYVLSALKNGVYSSPPGFKLKRQLQAEESLRIARELQQTVEETAKARFDYWWNIELSPGEREKIDLQLSKSNLALPKAGNFREIARIEYYRKQVFK